MSESGVCGFCEEQESVDQGVVTVGGIPIGPPMELCIDCKDIVDGDDND